jgi:4,5-DOPA dioxygenase extradiol
LGVDHHLSVGAALAPLRAAGVLIVGSGHMTHNVGDYFARARGNGLIPKEEPAVAYVEEFRQWIDSALRNDDRAALAQWLTKAPHARRAHPSNEHFLPLPLAFAAAGPRPRVERFDLGTDAGVLAMDAYAFYG